MDIYCSEVRIGKENEDSLKAALLNNTFVSDDERTIEDLMYDLYCVFVNTDDEGYYLNNLHVALSIFCDEGPFADLTVNIDGIERFPKNFSCIDTNDFPQGTMLAEQLGIGKPTEYTLRSGFCTYPVYEFDMDKIKEYIEEV